MTMMIFLLSPLLVKKLSLLFLLNHKWQSLNCSLFAYLHSALQSGPHANLWKTGMSPVSSSLTRSCTPPHPNSRLYFVANSYKSSFSFLQLLSTTKKFQINRNIDFIFWCLFSGKWQSPIKAHGSVFKRKSSFPSSRLERDLWVIRDSCWNL